MLAAMPSDAMKRLELFYLALAIKNRGRGNVPGPLAAHFDIVLGQAKEIVDDPNSVSVDMLPQAIQLANEFRNYAGLRDALRSVSSINQVSSEIAHLALKSMRPDLASQD